MVLDASRRSHPVPRLAMWSLGADIVATVGANLSHGLGHGPVGAGQRTEDHKDTGRSGLGLS
jgi:hypothetical protein